MHCFRSPAEVAAFEFHRDNVRAAVAGAVAMLVENFSTPEFPYDPDDGYSVLIEESDTPETIADYFGQPLEDLIFEGVVYEHGCFITAVLWNDNGGWTLIMPDEEWLPAPVRRRLRGECHAV